MHFSQKRSKAFLPLILTSAIAAAITGCNGGSGSDSSAKETVQVQSTSTFSAIYMGQVDHNAERQASGADAERSPQAVTYFEGTLTAVDAATNTPQEFDWPLVLGEDGMVTSQKTVTLEPGNYDFTLVVNRGSQQYTAVLLQYPIDDQGEYRLDFQLDPVAGDTIVDFDNVKLMSRLKLEFPSDELASIDAPQIGLIVDGVETIYQLNKSTGIADITLNYQGGTHTYDVNLYNGNQLIGRSALGPQSVDLELNTDFTLDLISLQADITVDISNLSEPNFIFNIPQEIIDHIGDPANVNLMARITDNENVQEVTLPIELVDGKYQASHTFDAIESDQVAAYIEFLDITDTDPEVISSCADSINVSEPNNLDCAVEIGKDYVIGGNLLATLAINVLDESKVAQSGAQVFVNDELIGVTGNNFGTSGFIKTHVKAGEIHLVEAKKETLSASLSQTFTSLSINNFDLILKADSSDQIGDIVIKDGEQVVYAGDIDNRKVYFPLVDDSPAAYWGANGFLTNANDQNDGRINTNIAKEHILNGDGNVNPDDNYNPNAILTCVNKGDGNWYLPAINEVMLLEDNFTQTELESYGFERSRMYWSSTERSDIYAEHRELINLNSITGTYHKTETWTVRCARTEASN